MSLYDTNAVQVYNFREVTAAERIKAQCQIYTMTCALCYTYCFVTEIRVTLVGRAS